MKKIYLLLIFFASLFSAKSQTLLDEDFEAGTFPPTGWTLINANAPSGNNWKRNTDTSLQYIHFRNQPYPTFQGTGSMVYEFDSVNAAKAWAITQALSLTKDVSYTISFYYAVFKASFPEKLKVTVGSAPTIIGQDSVLWNNNGGTELTNDNGWTKATITYTPATTGNFYFGFNCYSDADMFALMVDNVKVEVTPVAAPACAVVTGPADGATNISAPQALFTWDSAATASEYIFKLGTTNTPDSIAFYTTNQAYQSDLLYNQTYYWSVVPKNSAGAATGCPVYSFTTQTAPPIPANDDCAGAVVLTEGATVTGSTKSATQSMPAESCNGHIGTANDDVWFKITPAQSGDVTISLTPDLMFDGVINAYSGTCGNLVSIGCADQGVGGEPETITLSNLTAGETYFLRVYSFDSTAGKEGTFTLSVSGQTLPITLSSFKGAHNGVQNVLSWTTLTEQNNKGFELQRSSNGKDFSNFVFISSKATNGNSSSAISYQFTDAQPFSNTYYRLMQTDKDGKSTYSTIVLLKGLQSNSIALSGIYPNPAKSSVNIIVSTPASTSANIIITDLAGKPVLHRTLQLASGDNNIPLDINRLPSGSYFIKAVRADGSGTSISTLLKQ